jgi:hypothetical protein
VIKQTEFIETGGRFEEVLNMKTMRPWGVNKNGVTDEEAHSHPHVHNAHKYPWDDMSTFSIFTSWTTEPEIATRHAQMGTIGNKKKKIFIPGLFLTIKVKRDEVIWSPDGFNEAEKLLYGVRRNFDVEPVPAKQNKVP